MSTAMRALSYQNTGAAQKCYLTVSIRSSPPETAAGLVCQHLVENVLDELFSRCADFAHALLARRRDGCGAAGTECADDEVGILARPLAHDLGVGFDVKLQPEGSPTDAKCLVCAGVAGGQMH